VYHVQAPPDLPAGYKVLCTWLSTECVMVRHQPRPRSCPSDQPTYSLVGKFTSFVLLHLRSVWFSELFPLTSALLLLASSLLLVLRCHRSVPISSSSTGAADFETRVRLCPRQLPPVALPIKQTSAASHCLLSHKHQPRHFSFQNRHDQARRRLVICD